MMTYSTRLLLRKKMDNFFFYKRNCIKCIVLQRIVTLSECMVSDRKQYLPQVFGNAGNNQGINPVGLSRCSHIFQRLSLKIS